MQQSDVYVKCLSGDGAGELGRSGKLQRMLTERHVHWRKSSPYTPQSNGLAERGIKSLMYSARSSLADQVEVNVSGSLRLQMQHTSHQVCHTSF